MGVVHIRFHTRFEDCDEQTMKAVDGIYDNIKLAFEQANIEVRRELGEQASIVITDEPISFSTDDAAQVRFALENAVKSLSAHTKLNAPQPDKDALLDSDMHLLVELIEAMKLVNGKLGKVEPQGEDRESC